jgi:hypothetical protein
MLVDPVALEPAARHSALVERLERAPESRPRPAFPAGSASALQ